MLDPNRSTNSRSLQISNDRCLLVERRRIRAHMRKNARDACARETKNELTGETVISRETADSAPMLLPRRFSFRFFRRLCFYRARSPSNKHWRSLLLKNSAKIQRGKKGRKVATRIRSSNFNGSAVQSRESSIDVAKHMLRSRREKGDWVYARRAQYLLSSWHSHLSSKAATKKGVLVLYRVATTILALTIAERPMVVDHARAGGGIPISRLPPSNPPSSDQIFFVPRIGNPETILSLRDRPTREKFDVDLCALSPANKIAEG